MVDKELTTARPAITTGEELAVLPRIAGKETVPPIADQSQVRRTQKVTPPTAWIKAKCWFESIPPIQRVVLAGFAAIPLFLLGLTIIFKITFSTGGKERADASNERRSAHVERKPSAELYNSDEPPGPVNAMTDHATAEADPSSDQSKAIPKPQTEPAVANSTKRLSPSESVNAHSVTLRPPASPAIKEPLQRFRSIANPIRFASINTASGATRGESKTPWITSDGLHIYWYAGDWDAWKKQHPDTTGIWHASRSTISGQFRNAKLVCPNRGDGPTLDQPSVTDDGLYMVCVEHQVTQQVLETHRSSTQFAFQKPKPISNLTFNRNVSGVSITPDGLTLLFSIGWKQHSRFRYCTRSSRSASWSAPRDLEMEPDARFSIGIVSPRLSHDKKTLWFQVGGGWPYQYVMSAVRDDVYEPFGNYQYLMLDGRPLIGTGPCVIPKTRQIIYTAPTKSVSDAVWEMWSATLLEENSPPAPTRTLAGKTIHLEFLDGSQQSEEWGNHVFNSNGKISRDSRQVGTWTRVSTAQWSAGKDGFKLSFTVPTHKTSSVIWLDDTHLIGGWDTILTGKVVAR